MFSEPQVGETNLREASPGDISTLAAHHRKMFEEIWELKKEPLEIAGADELERVYALKLKTELESGICRAWVIEDGAEIISSGAVTIVSFVPTPSDLSFRVAYLHSMYTEKTHRNRKCAQRIIHRVLAFCKSRGIKRILLNASEEGRPVYQKIGFRSAPDIMRLWIA